MSIVKKSLSTEKSYNLQDKGVWTFLVSKDMKKSAIKEEIEKLFGVEIDTINTSNRREKIRSRGPKIHTRRHHLKIARVSLKDKKKKIDLTKVVKVIKK